jgi:tetratricopeptide (TPR) repeat protein
VGTLAYTIFTAVRDPYSAAGTGANLAEASYELGDFDTATRYASEVLELGHRFAAPYARFTLGQIDLSRHNATAAISNFADSMLIAQQNDDPFMVAYAQRALGQAYLATSDVDSAYKHIHSALALFQQLGIPDEITNTEQMIAAIQTQKR